MIIIHSIYNTYKQATYHTLQDFCLVQVFFMTFLFLVTWQFAQFALLLHSVVCFMLASSQLIGRKEVHTYLFYVRCVTAKVLDWDLAKKKKIKISEKIRESLLSVKLSSI